MDTIFGRAPLPFTGVEVPLGDTEEALTTGTRAWARGTMGVGTLPTVDTITWFWDNLEIGGGCDLKPGTKVFLLYGRLVNSPLPRFIGRSTNWDTIGSGTTGDVIFVGIRIGGGVQ